MNRIFVSIIMQYNILHHKANIVKSYFIFFYFNTHNTLSYLKAGEKRCIRRNIGYKTKMQKTVFRFNIKTQCFL